MSVQATSRRNGLSLVKGPVAIIGVLGIAMGVLGLIFGGHGFATANVPHGAVTGKLWLGLSLNGWTNVLFIAAGLLLLLGSSMHWGAKTSAFIVAGVLGAAAVIGLIRGNGVFGIFAANHRTEIVWGVAAVVLVVLSMLPRLGGRSRAPRDPVDRDDRAVRDRPVTRDDRAVRDRPVTRDDRAVRDRPVTRDDRAVRDEPVAGEEPAIRKERTVDEGATGDAPTTGAP